MKEFNGQIFFIANEALTGYELYKTDGTAAGTVLVKDINSGDKGSDPVALSVFEGEIYFNADDGLVGSELWKTDGTAAGTVLVKDIHPTESSEPMPVSALATTERAYVSGTPKLFWFGASDVRGRELWSSDGTTAGTVIWKDFCATGSSLSY